MDCIEHTYLRAYFYYNHFLCCRSTRIDISNYSSIASWVIHIIVFGVGGYSESIYIAIHCNNHYQDIARLTLMALVMALLSTLFSCCCIPINRWISADQGVALASSGAWKNSIMHPKKWRRNQSSFQYKCCWRCQLSCFNVFSLLVWGN